MSELKDILISRIAAMGPISLADYMAECLMHPKLGYYQQARVFGREGDFITAPEISQMFGEMIGLWLADRWIAMGSPEPVQLIELGPGRGTLMADIWRATKAVPGFHEAACVHFVETSTQLRALQYDKVPHAIWHDDLSDVPDGPNLIVANEFFDALPIRQYERRDGLWFERMVDATDNSLHFALGPAGPQFALVPPALRNLPQGSILEVCPLAFSMMGEIADRIARSGGAAMVIDYGYAKSAAGDTFQALKDHQYADPFADPGEADLTAHVAFDRLAEAATRDETAVYGPMGQGTFLMNLGLGARAQQLAGATDEEGQQKILSELKRLTAPDEMGTLFKVLTVEARGLTAPPGF